MGPPGAPGTAGPPTGPAGGALTGTYPNPLLALDAVSSPSILDGTISGADIGAQTIQTGNISPASITGNLIAPSTITTTNIQPGAITSTEIADESVGQADLGPLSVSAPELGAIARPLNFGQVAPDKEATVKVSCPPGSRLLSGGARWGLPDLQGMSLSYNGPDPDLQSLSTWEARGRNGTAAIQTLEVIALCLT